MSNTAIYADDLAAYMRFKMGLEPIAGLPVVKRRPVFRRVPRAKRTFESPVHVLYRMFDKDDRLLYVGLTKNPPGRFKSHSDTKSWWHEVAQIGIEHFISREELVAAEIVAIKSEKPVYNIIHNGDHQHGSADLL